jgi:predicted nucleic acid-binding protein
VSARVFVDSNIWLYAKLDGADITKSERARACLYAAVDLIVSSQILVEVGNNLLKKGKLEEGRIKLHLTDILDSCELVALDRVIILTASNLRISGTWSYWGSLIVAAALESGCTELWSEDLQTGRVVEGRLTIANPLA